MVYVNLKPSLTSKAPAKEVNRLETMSDKSDNPVPKLIEGLDYYLEDGKMVLTAHFLRKRGWCCGNGCRHCPYAETGET